MAAALEFPDMPRGLTKNTLETRIQCYIHVAEWIKGVATRVFIEQKLNEWQPNGCRLERSFEPQFFDKNITHRFDAQTGIRYYTLVPSCKLVSM
jgi:hypothetical protein